MRRRRTQDAGAWWAERRATFTAALIAAGITSFALYVVVVEGRCAAVPRTTTRVPSLATLLLVLGYVAAFGAASLAYGLGRRLEPRVPPRHRAAYRVWAFRGGLALSVALPLLVPVLAYRTCVPW